MRRYLLRENVRLLERRLAECRDPGERWKLDSLLHQAVGELAQLETLSTASHFIDHHALRAVAQREIGALLKASGAQFAAVRLRDEGSDRLDLLAQTNLPLSYLVHFAQLRPGDGTASSRCLERGAAVIIDDVEQDDAYLAHRQVAGVTGYRSIEATPIILPNGGSIGTLSLLYKHPCHVDGAALGRLHRIGCHVGTTLGPHLRR